MSIAVAPFSKVPLPDISELEGDRRAVPLRLVFCEAAVRKKVEESGGYKYRSFPQGIIFKKGPGSFDAQSLQMIEKWEPSLLRSIDCDRLYFVAAAASSAFFASLQGNKIISLSFQSLQQTLGMLVERGCITSVEKEIFLKTISTNIEEKDYVADIERRAIALSSKCAMEGRGMEAIHWLVKAKKFLLEKPREDGLQAPVSLSALVDLSAFWENDKIKKISTIEMFLTGMEEIADAAASSPFIKEIELISTPNNVSEACESLGRFLSQTKTLERLFIGVCRGESCFNNVGPLIDGLRVNSTVRELTVKDCFDNNGVVKLAVALSSPNSKVDSLTLYIPKLTDEGARSLSQLLRIKLNLQLHLNDCLELSREQALAMLREFGGRVKIVSPFYTLLKAL